MMPPHENAVGKYVYEIWIPNLPMLPPVIAIPVTNALRFVK